jgi:hypothetical protein
MEKIAESLEVSKSLGGRPKGTGETAWKLLETDLRQTLKLHKEIRDLIQNQISFLRTRLNSSKDIPPQERLDTLETLTKMCDTLTKAMQQSAKFVLSEESNGERSMPSASMDELLMGKKR